MKRRKRTVMISLLAALLMGCSATEHKGDLVFPTFIPEIEIRTDKLSGMADWKDVKIVDIGFDPRFQEGTVVQNDEYIFYPDSGNKIMRIEKKNGGKKCILELDKVKEKETGAQVCIAGDRLLVEYECDVFRCDFDGNKKEKIMGRVDAKKKISSVLHKSMENESQIISGMQFYRGSLYLFLTWFGIWKLDPDSGEFARIAEHTDAACFSNNNLYYVGDYSKCIYRMDVKTGKRVRIKGKSGKTDTDPEGQVFYTSVMAVDDRIYYTRNQRGRKSALYLYREGEKDKRLFTFEWPRVPYVDSTRVFLEYYDDFSQKCFLQAYDIRSGETVTVEMPPDYDAVAFLAGNVLFYTNNNPEDIFLSTFTMPEAGWE